MPLQGNTVATYKGHCPECGPNINASVEKSYKNRTEGIYDPDIVGEEIYQILKCRGCETVYVSKASWCTEDTEPGGRIEYWPTPTYRKKPDWFFKLKDKYLRDLIEEVYSALDNDLHILAAAGTRIIVDRAMILLEAPENISFQEKINHLIKEENIGRKEEPIFNGLINFGNAAIHREHRPKLEDLLKIIEVVENFLHRSFVVTQYIGADENDNDTGYDRIDIPLREK